MQHTQIESVTSVPTTATANQTVTVTQPIKSVYQQLTDDVSNAHNHVNAFSVLQLSHALTQNVNVNDTVNIACGDCMMARSRVNLGSAYRRAITSQQANRYQHFIVQSYNRCNSTNLHLFAVALLLAFRAVHAVVRALRLSPSAVHVLRQAARVNQGHESQMPHLGRQSHEHSC